MVQQAPIEYVMFLIFTGTAVLSTIALFTRQSLLVAYILLGFMFGPWGLKLVNNTEVIKQAGDIGIIFLLFLLGLHLGPQNLFHSLRKMSLITLSSSLAFFLIAFVISTAFGYNYNESLIIGVACMFSSTIIGIKLLPTTILHHQHTGELVVSILLLQDIIAIAAILTIQVTAYHAGMNHFIIILLALPILLIVAYLFERFVISKLLQLFDKVHEYIFILSIGWCLLMAQLSHALGLSAEIGAFIAGVALASHPIAFYIAESLKPLRDFFLVLFFFTVGASFDFSYLQQIAFPACVLALAMLALKPFIFNFLLKRSGEVNDVSWEIGARLGQLSEFSLLLTYIALSGHLMRPQPGSMLQAAIIITFIVSCYWTVMRYPTPLGSTERLRRD